MRRLALGGWSLPALLALLLAGAAAGCTAKDKASADLPALLRVGVLPDERPDSLRERHGPLLDYLARQLGVRYTLLIPGSYAEFVRESDAGHYDLTYFGGFTFARARRRNGAVPVAMRDVDAAFTSYLLVRRDDPARTLSDLRGRRFSFGSRLSTSGHLMPRYFLREMGIDPEHFFSTVRYSPTHDLTAQAVWSGEVDAGVANSNVIERMQTRGRIPPGSLRVLWESPPYPDYVWAVSRDLAPAERRRITEAFLRLSRDDPGQRQVLARQGARIYLPASAGDFESLERIIALLQLADATD